MPHHHYLTTKDQSAPPHSVPSSQCTDTCTRACACLQVRSDLELSAEALMQYRQRTAQARAAEEHGSSGGGQGTMDAGSSPKDTNEATESSARSPSLAAAIRVGLSPGSLYVS